MFKSLVFLWPFLGMTFSVQKFYYNWVLMLWIIFTSLASIPEIDFFDFEFIPRIISDRSLFSHTGGVAFDDVDVETSKLWNSAKNEEGDDVGRRRLVSDAMTTLKLFFKVFQEIFFTLYFHSFLVKHDKLKKTG